jgi:hypothetical protein
MGEIGMLSGMLTSRSNHKIFEICVLELTSRTVN